MNSTKHSKEEERKNYLKHPFLIHSEVKNNHQNIVMDAIGLYEYSSKDLIGHGAFAVVYKGRVRMVRNFIIYIFSTRWSGEKLENNTSLFFSYVRCKKITFCAKILNWKVGLHTFFFANEKRLLLIINFSHQHFSLENSFLVFEIGSLRCNFVQKSLLLHYFWI